MIVSESFDQQYLNTLDQIKKQIKSSQLKAVVSVNTVMLTLYWQVGHTILAQQQKLGWGSKVIEQLAKDIRKEFADLEGFSPRNLKYMRQFATTYPDFLGSPNLYGSEEGQQAIEKETSEQMEIRQSVIGQQVVAQLSWSHHVILMDKISDADERMFYIESAIKNGWSRNVLSLQVKSNLYQRAGKAVTNFDTRLTNPQSDLAKQTLKDPYIFDFLTLQSDYQEKDLENALTAHITKFLLELGAGFAYIGRQYHLEVGGEDFYIDLLFYHLKLRSYVVVELKKGRFKPEYAGKLNFYLSVVDDKLRHENDQASIGLLICQDKNNIIAEYALKDIDKPIGIAQYRITESIPEDLKGSLPTIEEIERELGATTKDE